MDTISFSQNELNILYYLQKKRKNHEEKCYRIYVLWFYHLISGGICNYQTFNINELKQPQKPRKY